MEPTQPSTHPSAQTSNQRSSSSVTGWVKLHGTFLNASKETKEGLWSIAGDRVTDLPRADIDTIVQLSSDGSWMEYVPTNQSTEEKPEHVVRPTGVRPFKPVRLK
jgi:hypothetical protein